MTKRKGNFGNYEGETLDVVEWKKLDDLIGQDIIVHEKIDREGKHGLYFLLRISTSAKPEVMFGVDTGAKVVMKKVEAAITDGALPCEGNVIQTGDKNYFDLIAPKGGK